MNLEVDVERLLLAHKAVCAELLAERSPSGYWIGEIGSSPVATAAAVSALVTAHHQDSDDALRETESSDGRAIEQLVQGDLSELLLESVHWLARRQNEDGGWGDCDGAASNIAATMLVQAAFRLTGIPARYADLMVRADQFVTAQGGLAGLRRHIGRDKAYLAPILANWPLADMIAWRQVPTLPFERLALPNRWQRELPAPASRYATSIVLAIGLAKFHNDPPHNPVMRLVRRSVRKKTLASLARLQAMDDSFLASPLVTAFVVMSLASMGCQEHAIVQRGIESLLATVQADASWAVTTNRATTNTSFALSSLIGEQTISSASQWRTVRTRDPLSAHWQETATAHDTVADHPRLHGINEADATRAHVPENLAELTGRCVEWLLKSQHTSPSAVTTAPSGGWGESDAPGAEPNTLATSGTLIALAHACLFDTQAHRGRIDRAAGLGVKWLVEMQNDDGGWPTYCRDDDAYPLGVSGIDPTVQAVRALVACRQVWQVDSRGDRQPAQSSVSRIEPAVERATRFLEAQQRDDGSFVPLWFGNEHQPEEQNPVLGTAQVLTACAELQQLDTRMAQRAADWLLAAQHTGGGWGPPRVPVDYSGGERDSNSRSWRENETLAKLCSVEETAAAVSALLPLAATNSTWQRSVSRGLTWLANVVEEDALRRPAIIGFYFSRIWYYERLYPLAFAAGALSQAVQALAPMRPAISPVG